MALTPEQLLWSATAAVEPSASLACVAALLCAVHASRSNSMVAMAGAFVAIAYAVQFRPESFLIAPVAGLLMWPRIARELTRPRLWWLGLLFLVLVGVPIGHMFSVRNVEWGTTEARLSLGYVVDNLRVNGMFYLADSRFPPLFTLLAVIGLPGRTFKTERVSLVLYFFLFFGIYLSFYAGSYNYGADVRYSLMTYPPIAALGGVGAARLVNWLKVLLSHLAARHALTAALAFQFLWYLPLVRATTEEAWAARADVRFARSFASELPRELVRVDAQSWNVSSVADQRRTNVCYCHESRLLEFSGQTLHRRRVPALELLVQRSGSDPGTVLPAST